MTTPPHGPADPPGTPDAPEEPDAEGALRAEIAERAAAFVPPTPRDGGPVGLVVVAVSLFLTLGIWGLALAARAGWALPPTVLPLLAILPVVATALVAWAFAVWTALPDRTGAPELLLAAVALPFVAWGPTWAQRPDAAAEGAEALRVVTWNVRRLWGGPSDGGDPTACVVDTLRPLAPDVVVLQEVTANDLAALDQRLGLDCVHGTYRRTDGAEASGIATCTRGARWTREGGVVRTYTAEDDWRYVRTRAVHADGRAVEVLGVHLRPYQLLDDPMGRASEVSARLPRIAAAQDGQVEALLAALEPDGPPAVVAGDFNAAPDLPVHGRLRRSLVDAFDRGAAGYAGTIDLLGGLPLRIDYVYATPGLAVRSAEVIGSGCSDHRPVVADLAVP